MNRCPSCDYPLPADRERLGARCPRCKDPLYEPATRMSRQAREDEASCPVHAGAEAVGLCARCGVVMCETCRTRWRGQIICVTCVQKALDTHEAAPEATRAHLRQSFLGLGLAAGAWGLTALGAVLWWLGGGATGTAQVMVTLLMLVLFLVAGLMGVVALGNAGAAIRSRGKALPLATLALALAGVQLGVYVGVFVFGLWQM